MKKTFAVTTLILFVILGGCNRTGTVTRTLHFVDLSKGENKSYQEFPREFSTFILDAVLNKQLTAYHIDYFDSGIITQLSDSILLSILEDTFYEDGEIDRLTASSYFSLVTLIGLDEINIETEYQNTNYINFYFPGELIPEGFNKYFCSVPFKDALKFLQKLNPPVVWNSYENIDLGWLTNEILRLDYLTSSNLAIALLRNSIDKSSLEYTDRQDSDSISTYLETHSDLLFASNINLQSKKGGIYFVSGSTATQLAWYTIENVKSLNLDSVEIISSWIMPIDQAFESRNFSFEKGEQIISSNGVFESPLTGEDKLSKNAGKKINTDQPGYKSDQKFYYRSIERISNHKGFVELTSLIYKGVRDGDIPVYENDSLKSRISSGEFFDAMLVEDIDKSILLKSEDLMTNTLIYDIYFNMQGFVEKIDPKGISLAIPGNLVPEGFDRVIGYFKTVDIDELLENNGLDQINYADIYGLPLTSWNIELVK